MASDFVNVNNNKKKYILDIKFLDRNLYELAFFIQAIISVIRKKKYISSHIIEALPTHSDS